MELLAVIIIVGVVVWAWRGTQKKKRMNEPPAAPASRQSVPVKVTSSVTPRREDPEVDVGPLTAAGPDSWVLNPESPLPLTLLGATEAMARQARELLNRRESWQQKVPELALLIAKHNLRFKEVDEFLSQLKTKFNGDVQRRIGASAEWGAASELDRTDLRATFEEEAVEALGVSVGHADLHQLLAEEPVSFEADDELLAKFGQDADLYAFYLSQLGRATPVVTVKAEDWGRKNWERLVDKGFAVRGKDIPIQLLLEGLRLKDLNELLAGAVEKPLGRKAKALEAALALPDLQERLAQRVAFREMFQAVPPADVDIAALHASFGWSNEIASLAQRTFYTGVQTLEAIAERKRERGIYDAWEVLNWDDPKPACAQAYCKKYDRLPAKRPPFHVGCDCQLENSFKD